MFRGRTDIFANRWQNQQGRSGYSVACNNEWLKGICNSWLSHLYILRGIGHAYRDITPYRHDLFQLISGQSFHD
ncbi:TOTE conflict system archaeo-eukaryotic primase domain-containing protein [Teredinibacter turnerae]|uniref:TOTE conflict system archaeo-eukaryotic primase domain-containing protein n=1 Tax=Teredinibacter turnerae TaxID=2426 RepID=UPI003B002DEA